MHGVEQKRRIIFILESSLPFNDQETFHVSADVSQRVFEKSSRHRGEKSRFVRLRRTSTEDWNACANCSSRIRWNNERRYLINGWHSDEKTWAKVLATVLSSSSYNVYQPNRCPILSHTRAKRKVIGTVFDRESFRRKFYEFSKVCTKEM